MCAQKFMYYLNLEYHKEILLDSCKEMSKKCLIEVLTRPVPYVKI